MKPEPSASISLKSLVMLRLDTPRAERSRAVNSSLVILSSSSVSNSCMTEESKKKFNFPFKCFQVQKQILYIMCENKVYMKSGEINHSCSSVTEYKHQDCLSKKKKHSFTFRTAEWLTALHNRHTLLTWHYPSLCECCLCSSYSGTDTDCCSALCSSNSILWNILNFSAISILLYVFYVQYKSEHYIILSPYPVHFCLFRTNSTKEVRCWLLFVCLSAGLHKNSNFLKI